MVGARVPEVPGGDRVLVVRTLGFSVAVVMPPKKSVAVVASPRGPAAVVAAVAPRGPTAVAPRGPVAVVAPPRGPVAVVAWERPQPKAPMAAVRARFARRPGRAPRRLNLLRASHLCSSALIPHW